MSKTGKSRLSRLLPKFLRSDKSSKIDGGIDSKTPFCLIHFLDDSDHQLQIKGNWKGVLLQEKVCDLLNLHEKDYFGLRFIDASGQTHWLDGNKSLSSQLKGCQTPHKLYFGVKFYAADPCKLREEITRYLFFLQVKQDILQGRLPVTFDEASELCAYAVQSELGDFDPRQHTDGYVSEFCFIPNQTEELERRVAGLHRRMGGLVPLMAEYRYLDKVKWFDMYGVDLHPVLGEGNVEYFLGLTPTGIVVYKNKNKVGNYFWPRINKVTFKGKIFIVKVKDKNNEEHVYAFELSRKTACKHLWKCCVEHHAFFSGRSERQANSDNLSRHPSNVNRLPSRRQPRRVCSDSRINSQEHYESQYDRDTGMVTMMMRPEPVRAPRHRSLPELQGHESPRSTKSAPWETNFDYGLYTHGKESPVSERSNRMREQRSRAVTGSDSESGISQRRKYFPNRRGSDNDSDVSVTRRRRRDIDSDSASDVSSRYPASQGHNDRSKSGFPVLYPFHDKENRPNGSIPSLHSAPAGEAKQRRRRRRSKSPSKRPPDELKQHFEYDLKDTDGLSTEELKEIPFVKVETKASLFKLKYSPKLRQKVKAAKQKSLGELDQNRNQVSTKQDAVEDEVERDMSVRSQPLPRKPSEDRNSLGRSRSGGAYDSDASASSRHRGRDNRPQDHNDEANHINSQYSASGQYSTQAQDNVHQNESGHNSRYSGQYSTRAPDDVHHNDSGHANSRYSGHYNTRPQDDVHRNERSRTEPEYERLHDQYGADTWSGQRGSGQPSTGHRYRDNSSHGQYLNPPSTSQTAPSSYDNHHAGDVSYSSVTSPSQTYQRHHHHQPPPSSSSKPSLYSSHPSQNHHSPNRYPAASYSYDQGQSSRSYGQSDGSRSGPYRYDNYRAGEDGERSGSYGRDEGRMSRHQGEGDTSRMSFHREQHVSRSLYQGESTPQHYDYQRSSEFQHKPAYQNSSQHYRHPSPQPQNQSMQSRLQSTPPKQQGTLPRHQGMPPRYQGTPPRYQGTPSVSGTPPRQNVDPRYSQGLLSVHSREHSEGSSSQASVRGNFHRSRPSAVPSATDYSGNRSQGNTLTPDQARQLLRSSNYNPDLCTEL